MCSQLMGILHACVRVCVFSGETVDREAISEAVQDAKELVNAFSRSSKHVPRAVAVLDDILNKLRPQVSSSAFGDLMGFCVCWDSLQPHERGCCVCLCHVYCKVSILKF